MRKIVLLIILLICILNVQAQKDLGVSSIDPNLILNANAVIRESQKNIEIISVTKVRIQQKRTVTVLNDYGEKHLQAYEVLDDLRDLRKQVAIIYDKNGKEIKKVRGKDFIVESMSGGSNLFVNNKLSYLRYTPIEYPYTVVYESLVDFNSTVFMPSWHPVSAFNLSVESSSFNIENAAGIPMRKKLQNLEEYEVVVDSSSSGIHFSVKDISAIKKEVLSPDMETYVPSVTIALNEFSLVGVEGKAGDWNSFGKWQYDHLLAGKDDLSEEVIAKVRNLTSGASTKEEKAKIIYKYVQDNTRYISVQLGIGGWSPMNASEVDRLGYGDCKALTFFTKSLMDSQGIPANYALVHAGEQIKDFTEDFMAMQGNHVILNLPLEDKDIWLECTNQTFPFNYLGDFTDNRNVLLVKPQGGEIVKTPKYTTAENLKELESTIHLNPTGGFDASLKRRNFGIAYGNVYGLVYQRDEIKENFYKTHFGHFKNVQFENIKLEDDSVDRVFTERLMIKGENLARAAGNKKLLSLNFVHPEIYDLPRNGKRKQPIKIERGSTRHETFRFVLPENYKLDAIPRSIDVENEFGSFSFKVKEVVSETQRIVEVDRSYVFNDGIWPAELYDQFRVFNNLINKTCNQKAVIVSNN